ncbi:hypothetical protein EJ110_NYTH45268 [Nymphaea thermarum]|nr:hypothetical protein EJ110_NYTH45268 [Nymphaea thermarum]
MWTKNAFLQGRKFAEDHNLNLARIMKKGASPSFTDLPVQIQVGIAYYSVDSECVSAEGQLLPQWLKGRAACRGFVEARQ